MLYAKVVNGIATEIPNILTIWDSNNYCTPEALIKDGISDQFGVVELQEVSPPVVNIYTHSVIRNGCEYINGSWIQKWLVVENSPENVASLLLTARSRIWEEIKAIRDHKTQTGGYKVGTKWYHSDTFSRTQQLGLVMLGASLPAGIMWKTMDGSFIEMTPTLAQQIFSAATVQDTALFGYAEQLKALVDASATPETVDIQAGWPQTYQ